MGVLLWRGFSVDAAMAQCFGNEEDAATKGRQMPVVRNTCDIFPQFVINGSFSILVPQSTISIRSLPRLPLRSHKLQESDTRSSVIPNVGERIAQLYFSVRVLHPRAISMQECYWHPQFHLRHYLLRGIMDSPYPHHHQNNITETGSPHEAQDTVLTLSGLTETISWPSSARYPRPDGDVLKAGEAYW
jgi:hypothetical protein